MMNGRARVPTLHDVDLAKEAEAMKYKQTHE